MNPCSRPSCGVVLLLTALCGARAGADGALPDSMQLLLPADRPREIIAATNFGLLLSEDAGASFRWVCEQAIAPYARLYQQGPPPGGTLYTLGANGLSYSADACTWQAAGGALAGSYVTDSFPDPADPARVLALAQPAGSGLGLYESRDGGHSFTGPLYRAGDGEALAGVEIARDQAATLVLTGVKTHPLAPFVLRSQDGGRSFARFELLDAVGPRVVRLLGIDPQDARVLYLRIEGNDGRDELAISRDGGRSVEDPTLPVGGPMSAFLVRADGTLLVGTSDAGAFRSGAGGRGFSRWDGAPHLRALGERDGVLYALADNSRDGFAVGRSRDAGMSWEPLLRFDGICGLLSCPAIQQTCRDPWSMLIGLFGIPPTACGQRPETSDLGTPAPSGSGGGCAASGRGPPSGPALLLMALLWGSGPRKRGGTGARNRYL